MTAKRKLQNKVRNKKENGIKVLLASRGFQTLGGKAD